MKSLLYIALLVIAAPLSFAQTKSGETTPVNPVQQEIIDLEHERLKAFARDDKATFERLVTDDLTMTHSSGAVADKAEVMAMFPAADDQFFLKNADVLLVVRQGCTRAGDSFDQSSSGW
jgi:hypothetical protein